MKRIYSIVLLSSLFAACMVTAAYRQFGQGNHAARAEKVSLGKAASPTSLEIPRMLNHVPSQLLYREGYTTSYNESTRNANWVAWHLQGGNDGKYTRKGIPYMVDEEVMGVRQEKNDWKNRPVWANHGHLCPACDCNWSKEAIRQTFLLTNICVQNSILNKDDWEELEEKCRKWAEHYGDIYIVAGPIFNGKDYKTMGDNKIGIPDAFYKVVLRQKPTPQALGFIYPNEGTHHDMSHYVLPVDEVESTTGIDFFFGLPDSIEDLVESVSDINQWQYTVKIKNS